MSRRSISWFGALLGVLLALFFLARGGLGPSDAPDAGGDGGTGVGQRSPPSHPVAPTTPGASDASGAIDRAEVEGTTLRVVLEGKPLPHARFVLIPWNERVRALADTAEGLPPRLADELGRVVLSDDEGNLPLEGLPRPSLLCLCDERAAPTGVFLDVTPPTPEVLNAEPGETLHGEVVTGDGSPRPGVVVRARWSTLEGDVQGIHRDSADRLARSLVVRTTRSRDDGTFEIAALPRDWVVVWTDEPGLSQDRSALPLPQKEDVRLVVETAATIHGRVVDDDSRQPIEGALLTVCSLEGPYRALWYGVDTSDAEGRFELRVPIGLPSPRLEVFKSGYTNLLQAVPLAAGAVAADVVVRLRRESTILGSVVDEEGEPVAGARVAAWDQEATLYVSEALTARDGSFVLHRLTHGATYLLFATCEGFQPHSFTGLVAPRDDVELRLARTLTLRGRLVADRTRFPGAWVRLVKVAEGVRDPDYAPLRADVDEDTGAFEVPGVVRGEWLLDAFADELAPKRIDPLVVDEETADREIEVPMRPGAALEGHVLDLDTRFPIPGVQIGLADTDREGNALGVFPIETTTAADGSFLLSPLDPGGGFFLHFQAQGYAETTTLVRARDFPQGSTFFLQRGASLEVRIDHPDSLLPFSATLAGEGRRKVSARSTDGAPLLLEGLEPGRAWLFVQILGTGDAATTESGFGRDVDLSPGETTRLRIDLTHSGSVAGLVRSEVPFELADRLIVDAYALDDQTEPDRARAAVGPGGRFAFPALPAGRWRFVLRTMNRRDELTAVADAEVRPGRRTDVLLHVEGRGVEGAVTTLEGDPLAKVEVSFHLRPSPGGAPHFVAAAVSGPEGRYALRGLPAGDYDVHAVAKGRAETLAALSLTPDPGLARLDLRMPPEGRLAARFDDSALADPDAEGALSLEPLFQPPPLWLPWEVPEPGLTEWYALPAGRYLLLAEAPPHFPGLAVVDLAPGERRELRLAPRPRGDLRLRVASPTRGPLPGLAVEIEDPATGTSLALWLERAGVVAEPTNALTDEDGALLLRGLPAGSLTLRVGGLVRTVEVSAHDLLEKKIVVPP